MIINTNMASLNTIRQLGINQKATASSLAKLSSGLKINSAADDAAGLSISEKMRGQISGLNTASSNAQTGINMVSTAEGALNETTAVLQRMRELAVQAGNDTNTTTDRAAMQTETNQLINAINDIGNQTQFNTKNLLNGGANVTATLSGAAAGESGAFTVLGGSGSTQVNGSLTLTNASVATGATQSKAAFFTLGALAAGRNLSVNGTNFTFATGATTQSVLDTINQAGLGVAATSTDGTANLTLTSTQVGSGAAITTDITTAATLVTGHGVDATATIGGGSTKFSAQGNTLTILDGNAQGLQIKVNSASTTAQTATVTANGTLTLQIGANQGQTMNIGIHDMRAAALGVSSIDLSNSTSAGIAVATIDAATASVSSERANLGAFQNRLEHTINNLGTASQNVTAAEASIRDVDMAAEMTNFQKNNILQQAAQAMLAQANQQPQGVLQLLR